MKYETPELIAVSPAIQAIQGVGLKGLRFTQSDGPIPHSPTLNEHVSGYADWE